MPDGVNEQDVADREQWIIQVSNRFLLAVQIKFLGMRDDSFLFSDF